MTWATHEFIMSHPPYQQNLRLFEFLHLENYYAKVKGLLIVSTLPPAFKHTINDHHKQKYNINAIHNTGVYSVDQHD